MKNILKFQPRMSKVQRSPFDVGIAELQGLSRMDTVAVLANIMIMDMLGDEVMQCHDGRALASEHLAEKKEVLVSGLIATLAKLDKRIYKPELPSGPVTDYLEAALTHLGLYNPAEQSRENVRKILMKIAMNPDSLRILTGRPCPEKMSDRGTAHSFLLKN